MSRTLAVCAVGLWGASLLLLAGCAANKNSNVQFDSRKTVHPKTPQQIEAIRNNPNMPASIKAQLLGQGGGPPYIKSGASNK